MLHLLHVSKKAVSLQRVFHSIRFKVNKRLGYGGIPFFMSLRYHPKKECRYPSTSAPVKD